MNYTERENQIAENSGFVIVGIIRGSHGLSGKLRVESTSGECEHFFQLTEVTLRKNGSEKNCSVESVEGCTLNLLLKCKEINSPEEAKKYTSWEIVVPKKNACPLKRNEFYIDDLQKCMLIFNGTGQTKNVPILIGSITGVLEGGAGDLLEVTLSESFKFSDFDLHDTETKDRKRIIPFKKEFIGNVDLNQKVIELMHLWILE